MLSGFHCDGPSEFWTHSIIPADEGIIIIFYVDKVWRDVFPKKIQPDTILCGEIDDNNDNKWSDVRYISYLPMKACLFGGIKRQETQKPGCSSQLNGCCRCWRDGDDSTFIKKD